MIRIIYFDVAALLVNAIIVFSFFYRKMTRGASNKFFIFNAIWGIITCIFDIWAITIDTSMHNSLFEIRTAFIPNSLYFLFHLSNIFIYTLYNISIIDLWQIMFKRHGFWIFHILSILAIIILLIVNHYNGMIFRIDEMGHYIRGNYILLMYFIGSLNFFYSFFFVIQHRDWYAQSHFNSIVLMYPISVLAIGIQWFFPYLVVEPFALSLVNLLVSQTVQRPEVLIDGVTGFHNMNSFISDTKRYEKTKSNRMILLVKLKNSSMLRGLLSYEHYNSLIRRTAGMIQNSTNLIKGRYILYYLNDGKFAIIVNRIDGNRVKALAELIDNELSKPISFNHINVNINAYLCSLVFPEDIASVEDLITFSNSFYNNSKLMGNIYEAKDIINDKEVSINTNIDKIIEKAYLTDNFMVYYQPIYSVKEKKFKSAESLLRLYDKEYGFVSPKVFIRAAEKSGAILRIGDYVLDETFKFIASEDFVKSGLEFVEINLSIQQCLQVNLADDIINKMKCMEISPDKVNFEITESIAGYSQAVVMNNLIKLNDYGIKFSLDDFGTGYSNLRRLGTLPITIVKLDKLFVDEYKNEVMQTIIKNVISMFKELDLRILVEGVENKDQLESFIGYGCDEIQGFFFSRPIKKGDLLDFLENFRAEEQEKLEDNF